MYWESAGEHGIYRMTMGPTLTWEGISKPEAGTMGISLQQDQSGQGDRDQIKP